MKQLEKMSFEELFEVITSDGFFALDAALREAVHTRFEHMRLEQPSGMLKNDSDSDLNITHITIQFYECVRCAHERHERNINSPCTVNEGSCPAHKYGLMSDKKLTKKRISFFDATEAQTLDDNVTHYFEKKHLTEWDNLEISDLSLPDDWDHPIKSELKNAIIIKQFIPRIIDFSTCKLGDESMFIALKCCPYAAELFDLLKGVQKISELV